MASSSSSELARAMSMPSYDAESAGLRPKYVLTMTHAARSASQRVRDDDGFSSSRWGGTGEPGRGPDVANVLGTNGEYTPIKDLYGAIAAAYGRGQFQDAYDMCEMYFRRYTGNPSPGKDTESEEWGNVRRMYEVSERQLQRAYESKKKQQPEPAPWNDWDSVWARAAASMPSPPRPDDLEEKKRKKRVELEASQKQRRKGLYADLFGELQRRIENHGDGKAALTVLEEAVIWMRKLNETDTKERADLLRMQ